MIKQRAFTMAATSQNPTNALRSPSRVLILEQQSVYLLTVLQSLRKMKAVVYVLLLFFAVVTAQDGGSEAPSAKAPAAVKLMSTMPACGTQCFEAARKASPCAPTNLTCSCSSDTIIEQMSMCVAEGCTIREAFSTASFSACVNPY